MPTTSSAILCRALNFTGTAPPSLAGDTIEIERSGHQTGWTWAPTVSTTIASDGSFTAVWRTNHIGRFAIRAVVSAEPPTPATTASATPGADDHRLPSSRATQYGPGFYGHKTACGSACAGARSASPTAR